MKNRFRLIFSIFIITILFSSIVSADGGMFIYRDRWEKLNEENQLCAINYENGYQNMILSINFASDVKGSKAAWIFPIPAKPEETIVDVIKGFPILQGQDIKEKAKTSIKDSFHLIRATQLYTLPFFMLSRGVYGAATKDFQESIAAGKAPSIYTYEHIEKMGITTELVKAKDGKALQDYLTAKQLDLPSEARSVFDEYIGEDYIFVISWIYDLEKLKQEQSATQDKIGYNPYQQSNIIGVSLTFPTDKIYFPLKPTSIYGSNIVPATIYVTGYVTPELYDSIKASTQVEYLYQGYYSVPENIRMLFNGKENIKDLKYTKITMNSPSKYLTEDLYFDNRAPKDIQAAEYFINKSVTIVVIALFICSLLASIIASLIIFRLSKLSFKLSFVGLLNILTIWVVSIVSCVISSLDKSQKKTAEFKIVIKKSLVISGIIAGILLIASSSLLITNLSWSDFASIYILMILAGIFQMAITFYIITVLLVTPFVWAFYNNKRIIWFIILFSFLFMILTFIAENILIGYL